MKVWILVGCLFVVSAASGQTTNPSPATTKPTTAPATKPAKTFKTIEDMLDRIPKEAFPKKGERWGGIHCDMANDWFRENVAGSSCRLQVYFCAASSGKTKQGAVVRANFFYTIKREGGKDWPTYFTKTGSRWNPSISVTFGEDQRETIAKLEPWENHKRGDRVYVTGDITDFTVSPSRNSSQALELVLKIENAKIDK